MQKFPITPVGFVRLENEIKHLKSVERPAVIEAIATAREFGDLSENAEYHAAREKQSFIEGRITELEDKLSRSEVIDSTKFVNDSIKFGATVGLLEEDTQEKLHYQIVGEYEADLTKKRVSIYSPIAKALIGKRVGDVIEVRTPKGEKYYEILSIKYEAID